MVGEGRDSPGENRNADAQDGIDSPTEAGGTDQSSSRVSRRRLLRAGINVGVGAAVAWGIGAEYATEDDLGTITYAVTRAGTESGLRSLTREVPPAWHESLRLAFRTQEQIRKAGLEPFLGSFVVPGSYSDPNASLSVDATDESVLEPLESIADGVAIDLSVVENVPPAPDDDAEPGDAYEISELDPPSVPGGVLCDGTGHSGTLSPALVDGRTEERFFATSNHVYGDAGTKETEHRGDPLWLPHDGERHRIGEVQRGFPEADVVQVSPVGEFQPASEIERASPSRVVGQYTKAGLADLMARDEPLTKAGAISGRTSGLIKGIDGVTCYAGEVCKPGQLKWGEEEDLTDGDSGSVNFHEAPEQEGVLIGGINNARTWWPGSNFTWGTAAHHLLDQYGLHF